MIVGVCRLLAAVVMAAVSSTAIALVSPPSKLFCRDHDQSVRTKTSQARAGGPTIQLSGLAITSVHVRKIRFIGSMGYAPTNDDAIAQGLIGQTLPPRATMPQQSLGPTARPC